MDTKFLKSLAETLDSTGLGNFLDGAGDVLKFLVESAKNGQNQAQNVGDRAYEQEWLDPDQAARHLKVSRKTFDRWAKATKVELESPGTGSNRRYRRFECDLIRKERNG